MPTRTRQRTTFLLDGGKRQGSFNCAPFTDDVVTGVQTGGFESMTDATGPKPWPDRAYSHSIRKCVSQFRMLGTTNNKCNSATRRRFLGYAPANMVNPLLGVSTPAAAIYSNANLVTKALANINPNRPTVDFPVFLFELREFPEMLRNLGEILAKRLHPTNLPYAWLAWHFGWAPLISDAKSLFGLSKTIDDRVKYLNAAQYGKRINRSLGGTTITNDAGSTGLIALNPGANYSYTKVDVEKQKFWYSAKLTLRTKFPDPGALRWAAAKAAFGLNVDAATLWQALPWSWLIDYLFNIGDVLEANRGGISFTVGNVCIMSNRLRTVTFNPGPEVNGCIATAGELTYEVRDRSVNSPVAMAVIQPFFTGVQAVTLGSLATTRQLRRAVGH